MGICWLDNDDAVRLVASSLANITVKQCEVKPTWMWIKPNNRTFKIHGGRKLAWDIEQQIRNKS